MRKVDNLTGPWSARYEVQSFNAGSQDADRTLEAPLEHVARTRPVTE